MINDELTNEAITASGMHCPKCQKLFRSTQAVRMHYMRAHTEEGNWGAKKGSKVAAHNRAARLEAKRIYNKIWRAKKRKTGDYNQWKRSQYEKVRDSYYAQGLNAHGKPFKGTKQAEQVRQGAAFQKAQRPLEKGKLRYVYPLPKEETEVPVIEAPMWVHAHLRHCPVCGEDLTKWKKQI